MFVHARLVGVLRSRFVWRARELSVVPASAFDDILENCRSTACSSAYSGSPLGTLPSRSRADVFTRVARNVFFELNPTSQISDIVRCISGHHRWTCDGFRVQCKHARLTFVSRTRTWKFLFSNVKFTREALVSAREFDRLVLVLYCPDRIYIYEHDLLLGVSDAGARTAAAGHQIQLVSSRGSSCWSRALDDILPKLDGPTNDCRRVLELPLSDRRIAEALTSCSRPQMSVAYGDIPLSSCSGKLRGECLEKISRRIDSMLHPEAIILDPRDGFRSNGHRRG